MVYLITVRAVSQHIKFARDKIYPAYQVEYRAYHSVVLVELITLAFADSKVYYLRLVCAHVFMLSKAFHPKAHILIADSVNYLLDSCTQAASLLQIAELLAYGRGWRVYVVVHHFHVAAAEAVEHVLKLAVYIFEFHVFAVIFNNGKRSVRNKIGDSDTVVIAFHCRRFHIFRFGKTCFLKLFGWQRSAEKITLNFFAAYIAQKIELFLSFNTLG